MIADNPVVVGPWILVLQLTFGGAYERQVGEKKDHRVCSKKFSEVAEILESYGLEIHLMAEPPHIISTASLDPVAIGTFIKTPSQYCASWIKSAVKTP